MRDVNSANAAPRMTSVVQPQVTFLDAGTKKQFPSAIRCQTVLRAT